MADKDITIEEYRKLINNNPRDINAVLGLAHKYLEVDSSDMAEQFFLRALGLDKKSKEVYNGLGLLEFQKGLNTFVGFTQAVKKLFKKDPFAKAVEHFNKALEIDKDYLEAYYNLGRTYFERGSQKENDKAIEIFKDIVLNKTSYKQAYYYLGKTYSAKADHYYTTLAEVEKGDQIYNEAIKIFESLLSKEPENPFPYLAIADIYINTERFNDAARFYLSGIQNLKDEEEMTYRYNNIKMLMEEEEQFEFNATPLEKKGQYIVDFFRQIDINPVTLENERLLEHFRRVNHVRRSYTTKANKQGYDDRGEIYLKYGAPENIYKSIQENNPNIGYGSLPNESWVYPTIHNDLFFDFINTNGREFTLVPNLRRAAPLGDRFNEGVLHEIYKQRANLGSIYSKMATRNYEDFKDNLDYYAGERDALWAELPPETFFPEYKTKELPFVMDHAQFMGKNGKTKVKIYYSVPITELNLKPEGGNVYATALNNQVVFTDSMNNRIAYEDKQNKIISRQKEEIDNNYIINDLNFELLPDDYILGMQLGDIYEEKMSIIKMPFQVRDFNSSELLISDMMFASEVTVEENDEKTIAVYPYSIMNKEIPIFIYFEIYNLTYNNAGKSVFTIEYTAQNLGDENKSIITAPFRKIRDALTGGKKQSISLNFRRESPFKDVDEYIEFNLKELNKGDTEIIVKITDLNIGVSKEISKIIKLAE